MADDTTTTTADSGTAAALAEPAPSTDTPSTTAPPATPTNAKKDSEQEVFDRLVRGSKSQTADEGQPAEDGAEAEKAGADDKAEAVEAQPDLSAIAGDPKVAKLIEAAGIKPDKLLDVVLGAYQRDGVYDADELTERFHADPQKFVEKGLKRLKAQKDQDAYGFEYRQWKASQGKEAPAGKSQAGGEPAAATVPAKDQPAPTADLKATIEKLLEPLGKDEMYAELKAPLVDAMAAMHQQITGGYEQKLAAAAEQVRAMQGQIVDGRIASERIRLATQYPDLGDEEAFGRVLERYDAVAQTGRYPTVEECFREAARWELGELSTAQLKDQLLTQHKQRKAGQPRAQVAGPGNRPMTPEDKERLLFNRLKQQHLGALAG